MFGSADTCLNRATAFFPMKWTSDNHCNLEHKTPACMQKSVFCFSIVVAFSFVIHILK